MSRYLFSFLCCATSNSLSLSLSLSHSLTLSPSISCWSSPTSMSGVSTWMMDLLSKWNAYFTCFGYIYNTMMKPPVIKPGTVMSDLIRAVHPWHCLWESYHTLQLPHCDSLWRLSHSCKIKQVFAHQIHYTLRYLTGPLASDTSLVGCTIVPTHLCCPFASVSCTN